MGVGLPESIDEPWRQNAASVEVFAGIISAFWCHGSSKDSYYQSAEKGLSVINHVIGKE